MSARRITLVVVVVVAAVMGLGLGALGSSAGVGAGGASAVVPLTTASAIGASHLETSALGSTALAGSSAASVLQSNPSLSSTPWFQNLLHSSNHVAPLASLPNLDLLQHPATAVNGEVSPTYTTQPAPIGLADYGIGTQGAYAFNVSRILGQVSFQSPPSATNPGGQELIDPGAQTLGDIGSPYTFGIQLNTILQNISLPGVANGTFWTQNVVNMNSTGIHFVQDIFNFSYDSGAYIAPGTTFVSGCGETNLIPMLTLYGGVYQCVGGTVPINAADFPLVVDLYNNVTVNSAGQDVLTFGYLFTGAHGFESGGAIDTVTFDSAPSSVVGPAAFTINGFQTNPFGLYNDAEIDLVGGIGGSNAVFTSMNGGFALDYTNSTSGFTAVPSAYDFGSDTGETSTGIASYWTGSSVASFADHANAGPAELYGLWNSPASVSAAPGDIQLAGSLAPDYGFVFAGNVAPDVSSTNLSYVPTTASGSFSTYVPPPAPGSVIPTGWYLQSWAPMAQERNGANSGAGSPSSPITHSGTFDISLAKGTGLDAPLYMNGNAQATSLEAAVTHGSTTFANLVISPNITFRHLNDYGFPSFAIFQATGISAALTVDDLTQSSAASTYLYDAPAVGAFPSPPLLFTGLQGYSQQINIFGSSGSPAVKDETLVGAKAFPGGTVEGGVVFLWGDTGARISNFATANATYGVFVGGSTGTTVDNGAAFTGSNAVDDVGSYGTSVRDVTASGPGSFGVYGLSSTDASYSSITATDGASGVYAGAYFGPAPYLYYAAPGVNHSRVTNVAATGDASGVDLFDSYSDAVQGIVALDLSLGVEVEGSPNVQVSQVTANFLSIGVVAELQGLSANAGTAIFDVQAGGLSSGVLVASSEDVTVSNVVAANRTLDDPYGTFALVWGVPEAAVISLGNAFVSISDVSANTYPIAVLDEGSFGLTVDGVSSTGGDWGVLLIGTTNSQVSSVSVDNGVTGVLVDQASYIDVDNVLATDHSIGVEVVDSSWIYVSNVLATDHSIAVVIEDSSPVYLSHIETINENHH
jgi:hypothetical protein